MRRSLLSWVPAGLRLAAGVVASFALLLLPSVAAAAGCPNEALRGGISAHLPDCRVYEQVTPPFKNGAAIHTGSLVVSGDGELVRFTSVDGFGDATNSQGLENSYLAGRTASGWASSALTFSPAQFIDRVGLLSGTAMPAESIESDTQAWLMRAVSAPENDPDFYLTRGTPASIAQIGPALPPSAQTIPLEGEGVPNGSVVRVKGLSADGSHLLFSDQAPSGSAAQWSFGAPGALLEYTDTGVAASAPVLAGVETDGQLANGCPEQLLGGTLPSGWDWAHDAMSAPGAETVFFTDACEHELFARIDNGTPAARTVSVSEPSLEDCAACDTSVEHKPAYFWGAAEDGSNVFFSTTQPLLPGEDSENLYEYDFQAPAGQRVRSVTAGGKHAGFEGVVQVSQDGSHVYFVASGALSATPNYQGLTARAGENNLYVYERDAQAPEGQLTFIATLTQSDAALWGGATSGRPEYSDVTPDGGFLVFLSHADLTAGDSSTAAQVFEYEAPTSAESVGTMVRVSIGEDGYDSDGNTTLYPEGPKDGYSQPFTDPDDASIVFPGYNAGAEQLRGEYDSSTYASELTVSANGAYVFFSSADGLTPEALDYQVVSVYHGTNGALNLPVYANNIYEYHNGTVSLISDGQDIAFLKNAPVSQLEGTDLSGDDVFFSTVDQLSPQDTDTNVDVYDARIGGGFPAPSLVEECVGDACQGQLSAAPVLLSPGSEFQAGGNPQPTTAVPAATKPVSSKKATKKKVKKKSKKKTKKRKAKGAAGKRVAGKASKAVRGGGDNERGQGEAGR